MRTATALSLSSGSTPRGQPLPAGSPVFPGSHLDQPVIGAEAATPLLTGSPSPAGPLCRPAHSALRLIFLAVSVGFASAAPAHAGELGGITDQIDEYVSNVLVAFNLFVFLMTLGFTFQLWLKWRRERDITLRHYAAALF